MASKAKGLNQKLAHFKEQFKRYYAQGQFNKALGQALSAHKLVPKHPKPLSDAAVCCVYMTRWQDAIAYADKCLKLDPNDIPALDAASHAWSALHEFERAAPYGAKAIAIRDASIPELGTDQQHISVGPSGQRRIIAFSLFGDSPKYCETAYLNVLAQPQFFPDWLCRFYVDSSVPDGVKQRLVSAGAEVIDVDTPEATWYGTFWRFLAADDPNAQWIIFRDADSLISQYEAEAVKAWIQEDRPFHIMRDWGSHTELMLAGMWGVKSGALPNMKALITEFLDTYQGRTHFADQMFLRHKIWPYARCSNLHHDSLFHTPGSQPFPIARQPDEPHLGSNLVAGFFEYPVSPTSAKVAEWALFDSQGTLYCQYTAPVVEGKIKVGLPKPLLIRMQDKELTLRILSTK